MDFGGIKILPSSDSFRSRRMGDYGGVWQIGVHLAEGGFMTVIGLILRDDNDIWRRYFGQVLDAARHSMSGQGEFWMEDCRYALKPRIDENGKDA